MMKDLLCILVLMLAGAAAQAHPGVGIVKDSRGNLFYTDTKQVWKIAPDGKKSVAVPNVHTHELRLDAEDNLYGEHLWYEGEATKKWGHRVWCLKRDGTLVDVIPAREGFLRDYSFLRDRAGNMYWADRGAQTVIKKRSPDGKINTHATADFRQVTWITVTPDGVLFLIDGGDLRRVAPDGKVSTVAVKLSERKPAPAEAANLNYHMGLWTDDEGNVYVAVARERLVLKARGAGASVVVARSRGGWSPSGGVFDRDGTLWLLEYSSTNAQRVRRIARDGSERFF
jgi:sugar lactone lactonase YvrE